jgi:hypothetical protein
VKRRSAVAVGWELELKTNTELTRQIHILTEELHRRLIGGPA